MARREEPIGIFTAVAIVLIVAGILALIANYLGVLPSY